MKIKYYIRNCYGMDRETFVDEDQRKAFTRLTNRKTLDKVSRNAITELSQGLVEFECVANPKQKCLHSLSLRL